MLSRHVYSLRAAHSPCQPRFGATCSSCQLATSRDVSTEGKGVKERRKLLSVANAANTGAFALLRTSACARADACTASYIRVKLEAWGALPVAVEKVPAGHCKQTVADDRLAPAPRHHPAQLVLCCLLSHSLALRASGSPTICSVSGRTAGTASLRCVA